MDSCNNLALIVQTASAVGECSAALVAALALIFASITIERMREQNQIAAARAGFSRIFCEVTFVANAPADATSLFPPDVETLSQREPLKQLKDVLERWRAAKTAQAPYHRYLVIALRSDGSSAGNVVPGKVEIKIRLRIPSRPGKNYISKRDLFTIPVSLTVLKRDVLYYLPIENLLACNVEANGKYEFAGQPHEIDGAQGQFDDYDLALGNTVANGAKNASPA